MAASTSRKKTKGKQKIEIKRIENEEDKLITFSKRRSGIIKKASELITLCGAEICFVVFSPSGKAFSFGHPSVDSVVNRFSVVQNPAPGRDDDNTQRLVEAGRKMKINELNRQYNELVMQLDREIEQGKVFDQHNYGLRGTGWWERPIDGMIQEELQQMSNRLANLRNLVFGKLNEKLSAAAAAAAAPRPMVMMPPPAHPSAPGMMDPTYQIMTDPYYGTNFGSGQLAGAGSSSFVPGPSYGVPSPGLMDPTHHQSMGNPYQTNIGTNIQAAGPSSYVSGPSYGIPPPHMMDPAQYQMMNNPYGTNIGRNIQGAGPSSFAPGPSYGIPPPDSSAE